MLSGALFLAWRIFEIIILIPIVGMLGWFVHSYVHNNELTPAFILVLFIVSVLALAWAVFTTIDYLRARHDAIFVALIDLCLVGGFIAGVYELRGVANANCTSLSAGHSDGTLTVSFRSNKDCAMQKACFALGIIALIAFFITFVRNLLSHRHECGLLTTLSQLLALLVARNHRDDDRVVVKREYRDHRTSHRSGGHRSRSRDHGGRSSRDYGYDNNNNNNNNNYRSSSRSGGGGGGGRRSHHSTSRRQYYV